MTTKCLGRFVHSAHDILHPEPPRSPLRSPPGELLQALERLENDIREAEVGGKHVFGTYGDM